MNTETTRPHIVIRDLVGYPLRLGLPGLGARF